MERVAVVTGAGRGFGREIARRLAGRGFAVLATDVDGPSAGATAEQLGGAAWSMPLDVRDPEAHRAAALSAAERGRLDVWVNNAGVLRTQKAWEHPDQEVRLMAEANLLGVIWGSRAAVDAMREQGDDGDRHLINIASLSALTPVPGLAVYSATKHGVLGFTGSLQGDLDQAGVRVTCHAVCPDAAGTDMVRERTGDPEAAIIWSAPRLLSAEEVAERVVGLLDSRRLVLVIPRRRGWLARALAMAPRAGLRLSGPMRRLGERKRGRG
jgi:NAD(P)-dependent dehydrogenase (short-subunit alcohol dehydrogenase family)